MAHAHPNHLTRYARTRVESELHALLLEDAARRRLTVSKLIRAILTAHYQGTRVVKAPPTGPSYAVARELNRIGVNLNQLTHLAHAVNAIDRTSLAEVSARLVRILERL